MSRIRPRSDSRLVHHCLMVNNSGSAVSSVVFEMDGLITADANTVNPILPSAARLHRVALDQACLAINTAGNWTLRLRVNEAATDSATMIFTLPTLPGAKIADFMSSQPILQRANTYHLLADGPSRNFVLLRAVLEWEIL